MNAIIRRELLGLLRTRTAISAQLTLAFTTAALVLLRWPTEGTADLGGIRSLQVLRTFGYCSLACILLITPAAPATSLVREKVLGTLALLLNTPLSSISIYVGKLLAILGFAAILLSMTVPAAAACHALGGTTGPGGVLMLYAILAAAIMQIASVGLLISSHAQSIDGALRTTYALIMGMVLLPLVPHWLLLGGQGPANDVAEWLRCLSPIPAVIDTLGQSGIGTHGFGEQSSTIARYLGLAILTSLACAIATISRLAHAPLDRGRPSGVMTQDRSMSGQVLRRLFFLVDPQRRSKGIGLLMNPILSKEFRTRRFGRSHWMLRLIASCAMLSLGVCCVAAAGALEWGIEAIGGALVVLQVGLLILFAPSLAAGLISAERETGSWQLLRTTPISPGGILFGKLLSVAWPLFLLMCGTLPGYVFLMTIKPELMSQVERVLVCLVATAALVVLISAAASATLRTTAGATAISYLVILAVCVLPLLVWLARDAPFGHSTVEAALFVSPIAAALNASLTPGFTDYRLLPENWEIVGCSSLILLLYIWFRVRQLYRPE
jgi:ABC-type transport system involved in multi-copper enzyme maturation permease subunit